MAPPPSGAHRNAPAKPAHLLVLLEALVAALRQLLAKQLGSDSGLRGLHRPSFSRRWASKASEHLQINPQKEFPLQMVVFCVPC